MIFGYLHNDQALIIREIWAKDLRDEGCEKILIETSSTTSRTTLNNLLSEMQSGDTLIVWNIEQLGSQYDLVRVATVLGQKRAHLRSIKEGIDTTRDTVLVQ